MDVNQKEKCQSCGDTVNDSVLTVVLIEPNDEIKKVCPKCKDELDCSPLNASFGDGSTTVDVDF